MTFQNQHSSIGRSSGRFIISPTETTQRHNDDDDAVINDVDVNVDLSGDVDGDGDVDIDDAVSDPPSRKISTETFIERFSGDKFSNDTASVSTVSTIDYRSNVVTTADVHRQIDVDDFEVSESDLSEEGTAGGYTDVEEQQCSIRSIPSSLSRSV